MRRNGRFLIPQVGAPGGLVSDQKQVSPSPPHGPILFTEDGEIPLLKVWAEERCHLVPALEPRKR